MAHIQILEMSISYYMYSNNICHMCRTDWSPVENRISVLFSQINLHSRCCVSGIVSTHVDVAVDYFL